MIARFRKIAKPLAALCALVALSLAAQPEAGQFATVDVFVASPEPVAAWQIELRERRGAVQVVGIERGDDPTFRDDLDTFDIDLSTAFRSRPSRW